MKNRLLLIIMIVMISANFSYGETTKNDYFRYFLPEELQMPEQAADILWTAGLFKGTNKGYELERSATRLEAIVMLLRFLGEEEIALKENVKCSFTDVPNWGKPYAAWAYYKGYTKGISDLLLGSNEKVTAQQYSTFMLRALGYREENNDFKYEHAQQKYKEINGTLLADEPEKEFMRGDMVKMSLNALYLVPKDSKEVLAIVLGIAENQKLSIKSEMKETLIYGTVDRKTTLKNWDSDNDATSLIAVYENSSPDMRAFLFDTYKSVQGLEKGLNYFYEIKHNILEKGIGTNRGDLGLYVTSSNEEGIIFPKYMGYINYNEIFMRGKTSKEDSFDIDILFFNVKEV